MPRAPLVAVVALLAVTVALVAVVVRPAGPLATPSAAPSPGPTAVPSQTATASPAATAAAPSATQSPTAAPTASPQDLYTSKALGFALTLPSPWHRAACGGSEPGARDLPLSEQLTSAPVMDEHIGHAGRANDRIDVRAEDPRGLTPMQFAQQRYPGAPAASVTFAGRPAVEVRHEFAGATDLVYILAEGDRMYSVGMLPRTSAAPDLPTMLEILRSFRFLSSAERQALPDPTPPAPGAPTAEALAATLKTALEKKDAGAVERVLSACVSQGVVPGGGAAEPRERFVAELRRQFAAGLALTVDGVVNEDTRASSSSHYVWSKWNAFPPGGGATPMSPGPETWNVQLAMRQTPTGWYWTGTLLVHSF